MLTAAVRDLHRHYPGQYLTDVRTPFPELWENNPYLTPLSDDDPEAEVIQCEYPLIHRSNGSPYHFIHGFEQFLSKTLDLQIQPTEFKGDIHLSEDELASFEYLGEIEAVEKPFWLIVSGGKYDFTVKWWDARRYQEVVDNLRGRVEFVQVGEMSHCHPPLNGVIDLRGQTSLRALIRLMHFAQGVLTPISLLMHLSAAVPVRRGAPPLRPCVVVAGGREPSQWAAYGHHQFIHTIGQLPCCAQGGCWKARTVPIGDGESGDLPEHLCTNVVNDEGLFLPRCMHMITSAEVTRRIEDYFVGGILRDDPRDNESIATEK